MVLPGHLAGGYLAARAVLFLTQTTFTPTQTAALLAIGTLAGEAPDIDFIFFYFNHRSETSKKVNEHRDYPTHAPLVWLILSLAIIAIGFIFNSTFVQFIGWMILAGSWSHFIVDSLEYGIPWLWPISKKWFAIRDFQPKRLVTARKGTLKAHWQFATGPYLEGWTVWLEIAITLAALWAAFR